MKKFSQYMLVMMTVLSFVLVSGLTTRAWGADANTWSIKADYIEACSCHLFCPCYFNSSPDSDRCDFNNAIKISEGHVGNVKVDGRKVWLSGNLGGDFSQGQMKSLIVTFEPTTTPEQQEAIKFLMGKIYPVKWEATAIDISPMVWEMEGLNGHAKLENGKGEVTLTGVKDSATGAQTVILDLPYWGAQKNTGFYLAKSEHHYKGFGHDYSYKDRNGFMIHIESSGPLDQQPATEPKPTTGF